MGTIDELNQNPANIDLVITDETGFCLFSFFLIVFFCLGASINVVYFNSQPQSWMKTGQIVEVFGDISPSSGLVFVFFVVF